MGASAALWAALVLGGDPPQWVKEGPVERRHPPETSISFGLRGRVTFMDGFVADDLSFSDLFDPGWGLRAESSFLWTLGPGWQVGPLLNLGWDRYDGNRDTDIFGDSLEPEDLDAFTALVGVRSVYRDPWGFRMEGYASMGAIYWSDVDATFVLSGVTETGVRFFDAITRFAFEMGGRLGWDWGAAALDLGFGLNFQGGPSRGEVSPIVDPEEMVGFYFDAGLEVRF